MSRAASTVVSLIFAGLLLAQAPAAPAERSDKEALQPFNDLIGTWKCTGTPSGSKEEQVRNFWTEKMEVQWQFKGKNAWLLFEFKKGERQPAAGIPLTPMVRGELRPMPNTPPSPPSEGGAGGVSYQFHLVTADDKKHTFTGMRVGKQLTLEREDNGLEHRLTFTFLHSNRFLYRYDTRPAGKALMTRHWQVGATKEGEAFAAGSGKPECIVSGGLGTMAVSYQGKTYYVCCSGCRSEFNENPAKYVAEFEAKKNKK
jgi:hypothetical protein